MSSIVKGIFIRSTADVCKNSMVLKKQSEIVGRRSTRVQWQLHLRSKSNTWKRGSRRSYQPPIRGQAILTPATPPTTKKVYPFIIYAKHHDCIAFNGHVNECPQSLEGFKSK